MRGADRGPPARGQPFESGPPSTDPGRCPGLPLISFGRIKVGADEFELGYDERSGPRAAGPGSAELNGHPFRMPQVLSRNIGTSSPNVSPRQRFDEVPPSPLEDRSSSPIDPPGGFGLCVSNERQHAAVRPEARDYVHVV